MCIVIVKPKKSPIPSKEVLKNCFSHNRDGIGYMYNDGKNVFIRKGFFSLKTFMKDFKKINEREDLTTKEVVIHFRYATHGTISAANTHPFPITNKIGDLRRQFIECDRAIAHNGIISGIADGIKTDLSDTMVFTKKIVYCETINDIGDLWQSSYGKLSVMYPSETWMIGTWIEDDATGIHYSNTDYQTYFRTYTDETTYWYGFNAGKKQTTIPFYSRCEYCSETSNRICAMCKDGDLFMPHETVKTRKDSKNNLAYEGLCSQCKITDKTVCTQCFNEKKRNWRREMAEIKDYCSIP